jgi:molecular chaperone DnaJ
MPRDFYEVLGINKEATSSEIKKAYRKLAREHHPDRNKDDPSAAEKFKEASEAYAVLSDEDKKRIYDQYGHSGLNSSGHQGFSSAEDIFSHFGDIFGDFFGGFGGFGGGGGQRARRGEDLQVSLPLAFLEGVHGTDKKIRVPRLEHCDPCDGSGAAPGSRPEACSTCGGAGAVYQQQMFLRIRTACPRCGGAGSIISTPCSGCSGEGRVRKASELKVSVPPGSDNGLRLRLSGKGNDGEKGAPPGDLYVSLRVKEHEHFIRDGDDIRITIPISYPQACLGAEIEVPTVSEAAKISLPSGTPSGKIFTLNGKGAPRLGGRRGHGDQLVQVVVAVPKRISGEEAELIRRLAEIHEEKVSETGLLNNIQSWWDSLTNS